MRPFCIHCATLLTNLFVTFRRYAFKWHFHISLFSFSVTRPLGVKLVPFLFENNLNGFTWTIKKTFPSGRCNNPRRCFGIGKMKGCKIKIIETSTVLDRFGSFWCSYVPYLKKFLAGKCFGSSEEVIATLDENLTVFPEWHLMGGIQSLVKQLWHYIEK